MKPEELRTMRIVFECPVCHEGHAGNDNIRYVSPKGPTYWCCSYTCLDIAKANPDQIKYYDLDDLVIEDKDTTE